MGPVWDPAHSSGEASRVVQCQGQGTLQWVGVRWEEEALGSAAGATTERSYLGYKVAGSKFVPFLKPTVSLTTSRKGGGNSGTGAWCHAIIALGLREEAGYSSKGNVRVNSHIRAAF